jgi:hypothetical protein
MAVVLMVSPEKMLAVDDAQLSWRAKKHMLNKLLCIVFCKIGAVDMQICKKQKGGCEPL